MTNLVINLNEYKINADNTVTIDLHEALAKHNQIAHIRHIEDVKAIRADLTDEQAFDVLREAKTHHDADFCIVCLALDYEVDDLSDLVQLAPPRPLWKIIWDGFITLATFLKG